MDTSSPSTRRSRKSVSDRASLRTYKRPEAMLTAFEYYNHCRTHSALGYLTLSEFAVRYRQGLKGATSDIMGAMNANRM